MTASIVAVLRAVEYEAAREKVEEKVGGVFQPRTAKKQALEAHKLGAQKLEPHKLGARKKYRALGPWVLEKQWALQEETPPEQ